MMNAEISQQQPRSGRKCPRPITERAFDFAIRIVKAVQSLPKDTAGFTIGRQLCRAGTGVGANVEEAQSGQSKREFTRRMSIARAEARGVCYWLRTVSRTNFVLPARLEPLLIEANELISILTTIVKKAQQNANRG